MIEDLLQRIFFLGINLRYTSWKPTILENTERDFIKIYQGRCLTTISM